MKRNLFFTTILLALLILAFSGCSAPEQQVPAEIPNPMTQVASLEAINDQLGFTFETLPKEAENLIYFTIADTIAQADFMLDSLDYAARKGPLSDEDISGVYLTFANGQTVMDQRNNTVFYEYNDNGEGRATWSNDNYDYSVFCPVGFDLETMKKIVNAIS